jgi:DNA polymerase I
MNILQKLSKKVKIFTEVLRRLFLWYKPEDVTSDMRRRAKEVNFGILYGIGPFGLKTRLGITQSHAKEIIDTYFNTFKRVKNFMDDSVMLAKEKGYAETLLKKKIFQEYKQQ